jgi:2-polyprenyl-3-methyl-5-hydroxy-6-metoxy-1,4-benzoquinol methylase
MLASDPRSLFIVKNDAIDIFKSLNTCWRDAMQTAHEEKNQEAYNKDAATHNKLTLDTTLYLAYRDIPTLLQKHLFNKVKKDTYRVLDFGCGTGFSTEIIATTIKNAGYPIEIYGIDVSEQNIKFAKQRLQQAKFITVKPGELLKDLGQFDLIICNFVLVENKQNNMVTILKNIESLLCDTGVAIITNCSSKVYKKQNKWYTFNNSFEENIPRELKDGKTKFDEDQAIKLQVFATHGGDLSFTFFDFFHSGASYRNAYETAQLTLLETHKPVGKETDGIKWESENRYSPYKIHVVSKQQKLDLTAQPRNNKGP